MTRIATHGRLNGVTPRSHRRLRSLQLIFALGGVLAAVGVARRQTETPATNATVQRVIDGDTLVLADGRHVRLIGVDTPERGDCGYREATRALERLAGPGTRLHVELGEDPTDRYGRTLGYLSVQGRDVSTQLARDGWAHELTIPPNTAIRQQVRDAAADAEHHHRGNWGTCP